jgi:hypothetical protein
LGRASCGSAAPTLARRFPGLDTGLSRSRQGSSHCIRSTSGSTPTPQAKAMTPGITQTPKFSDWKPSFVFCLVAFTIIYHHRGPHSIASVNPPRAVHEPSHEPSPPPPPDPSRPDVLQKYPLRIRSDICKATGSGWWTPKPSPIPDYMKRIPGHKAPYKIALEEEEETVWNAHANPVVTSRDAGTSL